MKVNANAVFAGAGLLAAGAVAYLATRTAGPVKMPAFTECREGPLMEHLVTKEELVTGHVYTPHSYPGQVAPAISLLVSKGFAPLWKPSDPQIAMSPAKEAW